MASEALEMVTENAKKENQEKKKREKKYFNYWSSIPHDILQLIAEKLSFVDCLSMSKVCMSWNAILGEELPSTQRQGLPCLLVSGLGNNGTKTCISVLENRVWELKLPESCGKYCWGSFCDWLIMVNILFEVVVKVKLLNPFSGSQIDLPPLGNDYHKMVFSGLPSEKNFICMVVDRHLFE
ncbi:putative F-box protein At4g22170 [Vigna angularis]|uniref:putative F-box protein At4g22170 n=1 Tax=Phaseolus angularis TaxID=3914 RepID=UPI000809C4C7|nr:putative F-box protein At4g22170 [Vigna angularis]